MLLRLAWDVLAFASDDLKQKTLTNLFLVQKSDSLFLSGFPPYHRKGSDLSPSARCFFPQQGCSSVKG